MKTEIIRNVIIVVALVITAVIITYLLWTFTAPPPVSPLPTPTVPASLTPTPTAPVSPTPTPTAVVISPLSTPEARAIAPQAVAGEIVTGTIAVLWNDDQLGLGPQHAMSSGVMTTSLYIDLRLRLEDGAVLTQTIDTGLSAPDVEGSGQFNSNFDYMWQDVPPGRHPEDVRLRWEIESSDVIIVQTGEYVPYKETVYGILVVDGEIVEPDADGFGLYRTVEVRQVFNYYLPVILRNAGN